MSKRKIKTALVAGASGSGKTHIATMFQNSYRHTMDNYFKPPFAMLPHGIPDWDNPGSVDFDGWIEDYIKIKDAVETGKDVMLRKYEFKTQTITKFKFRGSEYKDLHWIVLEGLFALDKRMHQYADFKVFVEVPLAKRIARRIDRDLIQRSDDLLFTLIHSHYTEESYQKDILPTKEYADLVIPNYEH